MKQLSAKLKSRGATAVVLTLALGAAVYLNWSFSREAPPSLVVSDTAGEAVETSAQAEMLYGDEQKPGVAINEAVELVKKYGAEDDYQFVNGLLGAVARERGETPEPQC